MRRPIAIVSLLVLALLAALAYRKASGEAAPSAPPGMGADPLAAALVLASRLNNPHASDEGAARYEISYLCADAGLYDEAVRTVAPLGPGQQAFILAAIAGKYTDEDRKDEASDALTRAFRVAEGVENLYSQGEVFGEIASKYIALGEPEQAANVAHSIRDLDRQAEQLDKLAAAYLKLGRKTEALHFLSMAITTAKGLNDSPFRDRWLASIAIHYSEAGNRELAMQVANTTVEESERDWALSNIAVSCSEAADFVNALEIVSSIADARTRADVLGDIGVQYIRLGRASKGRQALMLSYKLARSMNRDPDEGDRAWALAEIAGKYAAAGLDDRAQGIAVTIRSKEVRESAWVKIASSYADRGVYEKAISVLKSTHESLSGNCERAELAFDFADQCLEAGRYAEALEIARTMEEFCTRIDWASPYRPVAMAKIAARYSEAGELEKAVAIAEEISTRRYRARALSEVAIAYAGTGRTEEASGLLHRALNIALEENSYDEVMALAEVGIAYKRASLVPEAATRDLLLQVIGGASASAR